MSQKIRFSWILAVFLISTFGTSGASVKTILDNTHVIASKSTASNPECIPLVGDLFYNCGSDKDLFDIKVVKMSPMKPKRGTKISVNMSGVVRDDLPLQVITNFKVYYGSFKLFDVNRDFCSGTLDKSLACPVRRGTFNGTQEFGIPRYLPSGEFTIVATSMTFDNKQVVKTKLKLRI